MLSARTSWKVGSCRRRGAGCRGNPDEFLIPQESPPVPFHVMIWPSSTEQQKLGELYAMNITEPQLRERFVEPYELARPITWGGRTLPAGDLGRITITQTESEQVVPPHDEYGVIKSAADVTNDWIKGPPGEKAAEKVEVADEDERRDPKRVMVVHGRNQAARNAMFTFLRAIGLEPIEWDEAVAETGKGSPHNLEAVRSAMEVGQAVVVILTAEDQAGILPTLAAEGEDLGLRGQPRQNVILEAGLAMGLNPTGTMLVEIGPIRRASDFDGLNVVRLTNDAGTRASLRSRLGNAGCNIDDGGTDWMTAPSGGDFDVYIEVRAEQPSAAPAKAAADNPYSRAITLQRDHRLNRFLDLCIGIDQPFSAEDLAESMEEEACDVGWAEKTLEKLMGEGRVRQAASGTGWYSEPK